MTANPAQMQREVSNQTPGRVRSIGVWAVGRELAVVVLILASVLLTACASSTSESIQTSGGDSAVEAPRTGREIFASNCAVCHGAAGEGHPDWRIRNADGTLPPPPLNGHGHTWHHASFKSAMPAFGDLLSHAEIIEVLAYVKSLWGDKTNLGLSIRETQASISERDPFPSDAGEE